MTIDEQLAELLHELTPEPPGSITTADVEARLTSGAVITLPSRRRVWVASIAAAAVVLAVAIGLAVANNKRDASRPAVTPTPTPTQPTPTPTVLTGTITLGGATLRLPSGWVAVPSSSPYPTLNVCFGPRFSHGSCGFGFEAVVGAALPTFSADIGFPRGVEDCPGVLERYTIDYGVRTLSHRSAEFRQWRYQCTNNGVVTDSYVAQYVVTTAPAFVLFSGHVSAKSAAATLDQYAALITLPAQTAPLPLAIMGNVQSATQHADGWHVTIMECTRVLHPGDVEGPFLPVPGAKPETFVIPDQLVPDSGIDLVGPIQLTTDGNTVTTLSIIGG